jgi:hypothetical protein
MLHHQSFTAIGHRDRPVGDALVGRLKKAEGKPEFQCILLRSTLGASAKDLAQVVGWTTERVRAMHSPYVKAAYEAWVGREVAASTVDRILSRHGWRKIAPQAAFFSSPWPFA